jgi:hypothetical protein
MLHRRLRVFETNYGRDAGWFVERDGRCVAVLTHCRSVDMFWDSYSVEWVTDDPAERRALESIEDGVWCAGRLQFRNREIGEAAEFAFAAGPPRDGVVVMRGLYLMRSGPWPWECLLLWLRRLRKKREGGTMRSIKETP